MSESRRLEQAVTSNKLVCLYGSTHMDPKYLCMCLTISVSEGNDERACLIYMLTGKRSRYTSQAGMKYKLVSQKRSSIRRKKTGYYTLWPGRLPKLGIPANCTDIPLLDSSEPGRVYDAVPS